MSQHYFQTNDSQGNQVQVLAGWDRPLGNFFMVVEYNTPELEDAEPIYSNLDDPSAGLTQRMSFDYFLEKLSELGIGVPSSMIQDIEEDRANDIGNRVIDWTEE